MSGIESLRELLKKNLSVSIGRLKIRSDRGKATVKAKICFDVCRLFFDLFLIVP